MRHDAVPRQRRQGPPPAPPVREHAIRHRGLRLDRGREPRDVEAVRAPGRAIAGCPSFRARGAQIHITVNGMTCAQACRLVRSAPCPPLGGRRARPLRLRVGQRVSSCRVLRYGDVERVGLNGATQSFSAAARRVTWTATAGIRKRR